MTTDFPKWPKTPRFEKEIAVTEKLDGTNGLISIERHPFGAGADGMTAEELEAEGIFPVLPFWEPLGADGLPVYEYWVRAGSRNRWLTRKSDNHGFARWVDENAVGLAKLGAGQHYGEWFGSGIQRGYGLNEKRFALFNVSRWKDDRPGHWAEKGYPYASAVQVPEEVPGLTTVPLLVVGDGYSVSEAVDISLGLLERIGSVAVRGFSRPEGVCIYFSASNSYMKAFTEYGGK
ncbi:RNA ligase family protein [Actinoplanes sp. CA-054009]